jgi:3-methyladenine DNA glycosylase AlkC
MNELLDAAVVAALRGELCIAAPAVPWDHLALAGNELGGLALRARADLVSRALLADLPDDYTAAAAVFRRALLSQGFTGWMIWPVTETSTALALASPSVPDFDDGLELLAELTPRLTGEFAIRRFLEVDMQRALGVILTWTTNSNPHVRRLASEGTRAFLPWAVRVRAILASPGSTVPIIDALRDDDSEYVRRSVANHLNDLGRESPDLAVSVAAEWMTRPTEHTAWVVRHGLRVLVKKANPGALALMGFEAATLSVSAPLLDAPTVTLPGELGFTFDVTNDGTVPVLLAVDYSVSYAKSNGGRAEKVFKLAVTTVAAGETVHFAKRHAFRQMTTRVHYAGLHAVELQINGRRYGKTEFLVTL